MRAWRDAGGIIQLRESAIAWGPLGAKGEGTLALDQAMQPLAAGTVRIAGLGQTLSALSAAGVVDPQTATLAQMMFGVPSSGNCWDRPMSRLSCRITRYPASLRPAASLRDP